MTSTPEASGAAAQNAVDKNAVDKNAVDPHEPDPQAPDPQAPDPQAPDPQAPDPQAPDPQAPDPQAPIMIEAVRLSKFYGIFAASRDVSFTVRKGEVVAFLGPNGAGKSTTMKMLTGYLAPSEGYARIAGHDMATDRLAGAQHLGYLPETGPLYMDMTPFGMLKFFAEARGMKDKQVKQRIAAVVEICDLSSVIYKPINKLSKGYKQRVGMAQALIHEPEVLILDEPTSGLDPNQIRGVRETIRRLGETKTILLSTHILQEVQAMCSRVVMINEGRLVYDGPLSEIDPDGVGLDDVFAQRTGYFEQVERMNKIKAAAATGD